MTCHPEPEWDVAAHAPPVLIGPALAAGQALAHGWQPNGDVATIALRTADILDGRLPVTGMRSTSGDGVDRTCRRTSSVLSVVWARRLGGALAVTVFTSGVLLTQWVIAAEAMFRPFTPYAPLLPVFLALVLLWPRLTRTQRARVATDRRSHRWAVGLGCSSGSRASPSCSRTTPTTSPRSSAGPHPGAVSPSASSREQRISARTWRDEGYCSPPPACLSGRWPPSG